MHRTLRSCLLAAALAATATGCSDRVSLPSATANPRLAGAIDLGPLPADAVVDLVIGVKLSAADKLAGFLAKQADSRDVLRPTEFADAFAVSRVELRRLTDWLEGAGLTINRVAEGRTSVSVSGSAAAVERAFGTRLHQFSDSDGSFYAAVERVTLPAATAGAVSGIAGLSGGLPWRSHLVRPGAPHPNAPPTGPVGPQGLEALYNTTGIAALNDMPGNGETVAILGAGFAPDASDITGYLNPMTQPPPYGKTNLIAKYKVEQVGGPNRDPDDLASGEQGENVLDVQMILAIAPYANIVHVMTATNTPGLFADGISYIVNSHPEAHAVSVSYGTCERGAAADMPVVHAMLAQARAEGQVWFFAAGDSGADGCRAGTSNKIVSAGWPASAPWAVGVGGTQLDNTGKEIVWNGNATGNGAGGGGVSESIEKPAYQKGVTPDDNSRDEPDVAALSGSPGISIYQGGLGAVGGTSAATPMWAGVWALIEQAKGSPKIPDALERIYALGKAGKGFHDITSGNNGGPGDEATGGYPAAAGYDLATGWGTPNAAELIANWQ